MPVGGGMPRLKTELLLREMEALRRRRPNPPADMFDNPATPRALSLDAQRVWFALSKGGPATAWALLAMCIGLDIDAIEAALVECQSGGGVDFTYKGIRYDAKTVRAGYDQIMCLPRENPRVQAYAFARLPDLARDAPVHQSNLRRVELVGRCRADILRAPANLKRLPWGEMYVLHESLLAQWPVPAVVCEIDLDFVERYERTGRATWGQRW